MSFGKDMWTKSKFMILIDAKQVHHARGIKQAFLGRQCKV